MKTLIEKIEESIALIRKGEKLAMLMQPEHGYWVGFSGGKDSQVVLELCKMAGVKYQVIYNNTTIDPPENVRFIRDNYPDVKFDNPDTNFFKLIEKNGLPSRISRFCCRILKERGGIGYVTITGVRHQESRNRGGYQQVMKKGKTKKDSEVKDLDKMESLNFQCVNGNDKFMLYPILEWTETDVWQFIAMRRLPYNVCYNIKHRVGCMFCPFATRDEIQNSIEKYPKHWILFKKSFGKYFEKMKERDFDTVDEYIDWWLSDLSVKEYKEKQKQLVIDFD
ncbi:MAG: phosphoadenosine phosphosulfate reductase family protein [Bacteroidales bacterium]|nr:phosphoadenosine phosphosulfate reductase family protein [Bacteroidales bacterium]